MLQFAGKFELDLLKLFITMLVTRIACMSWKASICDWRETSKQVDQNIQ